MVDTSEKYMLGFGNHLISECLPGAVPKDQNNPQKCPYGLYCEQLSGTPFTYARYRNQRTWVYRIWPTTYHQPFQESPNQYPLWISNFETDINLVTTPQQLRWKPIQMPSKDKQINFLEGVKSYCGAGSPQMKNGISIHNYSFNSPMGKHAFYSSDGDILFVPQEGDIKIKTELGIMCVKPQEIAVIQRGIKFQIDPLQDQAKGYFCEVYQKHFVIPDLGPIGANCCANPQDFQIPVANYEDTEEEWVITTKFQGKFFDYKQNHSPYDIVGFHGNYLPYKYDLAKFKTIGSISQDHPDPSIFTVLTSQTDDLGQATCDFVIFPPRWLSMEKTFRPPYYHRNTMSEFMGNISGTYDAKEEGFIPGSASLHSCMTGHGPEAAVFEKASNSDLKPAKTDDNSYAFMFETCYQLKMTKQAMLEENLDMKYFQCWSGLIKHFDKNMKIQ